MLITGGLHDYGKKIIGINFHRLLFSGGHGAARQRHRQEAQNTVIAPWWPEVFNKLLV